MLVKSDVQLLRDAKSFARSPYAWPGGYPLALITADGAALCAQCVKKEWRLICAETFENTNLGFRVAGVSVNWEDADLYCDHCSARIESAYAESE